MSRSTRARGRATTETLGSPPLVTIQRAAASGVACDLNETIDENDPELLLFANEQKSKVEKKTNVTKQNGKRKRKADDALAPGDGDKENKFSASHNTAKRKKRQPLAPRGAQLSAVGPPPASVNSTQESPPIFAYKQGKTALKARKLRKEKQQTQQDNQKRLEDLAAYFANVDAEKLAYL